MAKVFSIGMRKQLKVDFMDYYLGLTYFIALLQIIAGFIIIIKNKYIGPVEGSPIPMIGAILIGLADVILIIFLLMYS